MIYFLFTKNHSGYWLSYLVVLLTKEEYGLLGIPFGIYIFLYLRNFRQAFFTALVGVTAFIFLVFYLMPNLSNLGSYRHFSSQNKPTKIIAQILSQPLLVFSRFVDHPEKQKTIIISLASFGFLPLLVPGNLLLPLFSLALRFYDPSTPRRFEFNNHYAPPFIPLLAMAAMFGAYKKHSASLIAFVLMTTLAQNFIFHGPINSLFKQSFYETPNWELDARELIKQVPPHVTVAAQNSLLPHLSQRSRFYLLPEIGTAEFIAVDLTNGPNKFSPLDLISTAELINQLIASQQFRVIWQQNQALLLQRVK